jgi:hypothetical protein
LASKDKQYRGQALLAVNQFPRAVRASLDHHGLQTIEVISFHILCLELPDVVQQIHNLLLRPSEAALVRRNKEPFG